MTANDSRIQKLEENLDRLAIGVPVLHNRLKAYQHMERVARHQLENPETYETDAVRHEYSLILPKEVFHYLAVETTIDELNSKIEAMILSEFLNSHETNYEIISEDLENLIEGWL